MAAEIRVPTLGESVTEATVGTWFKKSGDQVKADEMVCVLETDKVAVEVPSPTAGVLGEIAAPEGDNVEPGALLAIVEASGEETAPERKAPKKPAVKFAPNLDKDEKAAVSRPDQDIEDAPSAKKLMEEHGLARDQVKGTGRKDRIMKEDVLQAVAAAEQMSEIPAAPMAGAGAGDAMEERVPMSRLRQTIARRLKDAQNTAAMLTTYNELDMSGIMAIRAEYKDVFAQKYGVKLGFMSFFVKACCSALVEVPEVNAEIDGTDIVYKKFVHMGIAVGTPTGLVVPVVRNAHAMQFADIEQRIAELGARARDGKLSLAEMQGGTFTISNGGVYGSLLSSPILNPPQSGILGMHKIQDRPVAIDREIAIRPMMYLALSYDHRIVDGKGAVTFLVRVKEALEDPRRLLMGI